jgi:hypothetical protein
MRIDPLFAGRAVSVMIAGVIGVGAGTILSRKLERAQSGFFSRKW